MVSTHRAGQTYHVGGSDTAWTTTANAAAVTTRRSAARAGERDDSVSRRTKSRARPATGSLDSAELHPAGLDSESVVVMPSTLHHYHIGRTRCRGPVEAGAIPNGQSREPISREQRAQRSVLARKHVGALGDRARCVLAVVAPDAHGTDDLAAPRAQQVRARRDELP